MLKNESIFFNNRYFVELSLYKTNLENVPSSHEITLTILIKVIDKLNKKCLLANYSKVFQNQLRNDIV